MRGMAKPHLPFSLAEDAADLVGFLSVLLSQQSNGPEQHGNPSSDFIDRT
jgi:hypothetical protein